MNKIAGMILGIVALGIAVTGCDAGMGPSGPSTAEVKKQIESMPPEKQIQLIQNSPMKPDEKKTKIDEIKQKYNITGDVPAGAPTPGAPPVGTPGK